MGDNIKVDVYNKYIYITIRLYKRYISLQIVTVKWKNQ